MKSVCVCVCVYSNRNVLKKIVFLRVKLSQEDDNVSIVRPRSVNFPEKYVHMKTVRANLLDWTKIVKHLMKHILIERKLDGN